MKTTEFYPTPTRFSGGLVSDYLVLPQIEVSPVPSTDTLYNIGGTLYWNGTPVGTGTDKWSYEGAGPNIYYAAGNVGIAIATPTSPLHIGAEAKFNDVMIIANNKQLQFQDTLGGVTAYACRDTSDNLVIYNATSTKDIQLTTTSGKVVVTGDMSVTGSLKMQETGGGSDLATISIAALTAARAYTIPDAGAPANFVLSTTATPAQGDVLYFNGTSWVSLAAGDSGKFLQTLGASSDPQWATAGAAPAGNDTDIQYKDGAALGGSDQLTFNKTTGLVTISPAGDSALQANGDITIRAGDRLIFSG